MVIGWLTTVKTRAFVSALLALCTLASMPSRVDALVAPTFRSGRESARLLSLPESGNDSSGPEQTLAQLIEPPGTSQIEETTRKILLKEVELERYNLNYRLNVAKQGRYKGWRYFGTQETNALLSMSGYITSTVERGKNFTTFHKLKRHILENGNVLTFIGQIIGASGSAGEFGINAWHDRQESTAGYSPAQGRLKVLGLRHEIDSLLLERASLIGKVASSKANSNYIALANAEENVLRDIEGICLDEFVNFHSRARRLFAFQQSLYLLDIARNTTGALASRFAWDGLRYQNRHFNTTAGIFGEISGGLTILTPLISRGIGKAVGEYHKHYARAVTSGTKSANADALEKDLDQLKLLASDQYLEHADLPLLRCALYGEHARGVRKQLALSSREIRAGYLEAAENVAAGGLIGSTRVAGATLFLVAGIVYRRSTRHTNIYLGSASICGTVGTAFATLDNIRLQLKSEHDRHKLAKEGLLPEQIIRERLNKLQEIEKVLISSTDNKRISQLQIDQSSAPWTDQSVESPKVPCASEEPDLIP